LVRVKAQGFYRHKSWSSDIRNQPVLHQAHYLDSRAFVEASMHHILPRVPIQAIVPSYIISLFKGRRQGM